MPFKIETASTMSCNLQGYIQIEKMRLLAELTGSESTKRAARVQDNPVCVASILQ
jgi:hypothetical protein